MFSKHNHHKERSNYSAVPHFSDSDDDDSSDDGMEDDFISREIRQQQLQIQRQDEGLEMLGQSAERLSKISLGIHEELGHQNKIRRYVEPVQIFRNIDDRRIKTGCFSTLAVKCGIVKDWRWDSQVGVAVFVGTIVMSPPRCSTAIPNRSHIIYSESEFSKRRMLDEMEDDLENATTNMNLVTMKTKELIKKSGGKRNFCIIVVLSIIVVVLLFLIIYS
ncbi:hypothetical protein ACHAXS_005666 [Conticribra weissflogii]